MIRVCMYCQRFMGFKAPFANTEVTHGACPECIKHFKAGHRYEHDQIKGGVWREV